jgi:hypothetical protein
MTQPVPLQRDVPCARCGYDLRGLTPPGKCPECGFDIDQSIRTLHAAGVVAPPQRRWTRHMIEGVTCALISFAVPVVSNFVFGDLRSGQRTSTVVATTIVVWTLSAYAGWKLAALEPREVHEASRRRVSAALRGSSAAFLALGALTLWLTGRSDALPMWRLGFSLLASTAAVTFFLRVRHAAIRLGLPGLGGQSLMVAALSPAVILTIGFGTNDGLFGITPLVGWSGTMRYLVRNLTQWRDWADLTRLVSWPVLFTICQVAVLVQLLVALIRARRRATEG